MTGRFVKCAGCPRRIDTQKETPGKMVVRGATHHYHSLCWAKLLSQQVMGMGKNLNERR